MLFNSIPFLIFLAVVLLVYPRLKHRSQNFFLLAASYLFYGWWDWRFLILLWISTVVDFSCAKQIHLGIRPKMFLTLSILTNLSILCLFKYFNFFSDSLQTLFHALGWNLDPITLNVILPVGISFYTFQSLSYTIDVYRKQIPASDNLTDVALYVSFFPQLVAGPIERASHFLPQVQQPREVTANNILDGVWLIILGFVKKLVIADQCASIVDPCFQSETMPFHGFANWVVIYAFAMQIYGDFSGYTDIARGTSKLLGFDLMNNFGKPYLVTNPSNFWRNWHISLSTWLRDYLYIPLGGNRFGTFLTFRNLMLTMALGGLWHGAGWAFLAWGIFHGLLLVVFRMLPGAAKTGSPSPIVTRLLGGIVFFHITCVGWLIFRAGSLSADIDQINFLSSTFLSLAPWSAGLPVDLIRAVLPLMLAGLAFQYWHKQMDRFHAWSIQSQSLAVGLALCSIATLGVFNGSGFIYFQF